jgi:hypothetical protein
MGHLSGTGKKMALLLGRRQLYFHMFFFSFSIDGINGEV